jgi:hypothetical protein
MDSSLECFAYALNALGYLLSPDEFLDITSDNNLRQISSAKLFEIPPSGRAASRAHDACLKWFPRICGHWSAHRPLLAQIIEYHDATKHRHSVVVGQGPDGHLLKAIPKQAMGNIVFTESAVAEETVGFVPHNEEHSLQSVTTAYRTFMVDWLRLTREEVEIIFGVSLAPRSG